MMPAPAFTMPLVAAYLGHRHQYSAVLNGIVPAKRDHSGRRRAINADDLPRIEEAMRSNH